MVAVHRPTATSSVVVLPQKKLPSSDAATTRTRKRHPQQTTVVASKIQSSPLPLLSATWLLLCTGLVIKYPNLLAVFWTFVTCWIVSSLPLLPANEKKNQVGVLCCLYQLWQLRAPEEEDSIGSTATPPSSYQALCTAAGYLAFNHWFAALRERQPPPRNVVTENALTLTLWVVLLVVCNPDDGVVEEEGNEGSSSSSGSLKLLATSWSIYKLIRLLLARNNTSCTEDQGMVTQRSSVSTWKIRGQEYDLTPFVDRHPGGKEAILLGRGREDCTALFVSYHPFSKERVRAVLQPYAIAGPPKKTIVAGATNAKRKHADADDPFYDIMCQRVEETLRAHGLDPLRDRSASVYRRLYYCGITAAVILCSYYHAKGSTLASLGLAIFGWLFGAIGHDAGHFSASRLAWVNDAGVWAMSLLCNPMLWQHQHTFAHHSHTNDFAHDPDLHHFSTLLRVHRRFQQDSIYKNQANTIYVFLAYMFVVFGTCVWMPWGMVKEGTLYGVVEWSDRHRPLRAIGMYAHLIVYSSFLILLPFWVHATWWSALGTVILHVGTSGVLFAIFSQINHLNEASLQPESLSHASWAANQVETSNNFCPQSTLWFILSNGLNLQIEHHLFPGLNHCHLSIIQPTVQRVCEEHGVRYKSYDSWSDIMQATLRWLDLLSAEQER